MKSLELALRGKAGASLEGRSRSPSSSPSRSSSRRRARSFSGGSNGRLEAPGSSPRSGGGSPPSPPGAEESVVAFLGTGSAVPSKYRNVSGIWVNVSPEQGSSSSPSSSSVEMGEAGVEGLICEKAASVETNITPEQDGAVEVGASAGFPKEASSGGSILLDAGEGTLGQMWRIFGESADVARMPKHDRDEPPESDAAAELSPGRRRSLSSAGALNIGAEKALRDLSAVWISHPHADHHLGLVRILSERNKLLRGDARAGVTVGKSASMDARHPNLLLMGPAPVAAWLQVRHTFIYLCVLIHFCLMSCFVLFLCKNGIKSWDTCGVVFCGNFVEDL